MNKKWIYIFILFLMGCDQLSGPIKETESHYDIRQGYNFNISLLTELSSSKNERGDTFSCKLLTPIQLSNKKDVLPTGTTIKGLVKRIKKYERFGDKANLTLLFDQITLSDGRTIPMVATLDTSQGNNAVRIKGKMGKNIKVVGTHALVGGVAGKLMIKDQGLEKGILVGTALGMGTVIMSDAKEVKLPVGTEFTVKLEERLVIPK